MQIVICDDEPEVLADEARIISEILTEKSVEYNLTTFNSPQELLDSDVIYDIAFLDIEMDDMNGIDLARKITEQKSDCLIFFLTNFSIYLDNAFDVNAIRYLTKPVDKNRLASGIDSALERISRASKTISVTNLKNRLSLDITISSIIFIENEGRHTHIVSTKQDFTASEVFSSVKKQIEKEVNYFTSAHQSFFVNLRYVMAHTKESVTLSYGGKMYKVDMSRRQFSSFDKKMFLMAKDL